MLPEARKPQPMVSVGALPWEKAPKSSSLADVVVTAPELGAVLLPVAGERCWSAAVTPADYFTLAIAVGWRRRTRDRSR